MSLAERPSIGIVGAGKVGATLARLLYAADYRVAAVFSRTPEHARELARQVGAETVDSADEVAGRSDLTLLTVPDDALEQIASDLADGAGAGRAVVHTSGARGADVLAAVAACGAMVGSLHPAFPFADVERSMLRLPGATFAVEAESDGLLGWLMDVVGALNGQVLIIPPGRKPIYHAALVFASNYTVTLYALAESLLVGLGAERVIADGALDALLAGTVENIRTQGIPNALTGPLVRADAGTVEDHLAALAQVDPRLAEAYALLARLSLPMVVERGVDITALETLLQQGK